MHQCRNLYVHFPFCRRKCTYCALHSRVRQSETRKLQYITTLIDALDRMQLEMGVLKTVYFGGGTPALCDLTTLLEKLKPHLASDYEWTVELHPEDATDAVLKVLKDGGVNRISMGVQSLEDEVLKDMNRGYTFEFAEKSFKKIREYFSNAGIDLIVGYPLETAALVPRHARLAKWGLKHVSVYSLILEETSLLKKRLEARNYFEYESIDDDVLMNRLGIVASFMEGIGLDRYEISNYAKSGYECQHNLAVWRGEDYYGLGDGAKGRIGRFRTANWFGEELKPTKEGTLEIEEVDEKSNKVERMLFRLRTREGIDSSEVCEWKDTLEHFHLKGLLSREGDIYRLTSRGTEVCDSILADLV